MASVSRRRHLPTNTHWAPATVEVATSIKPASMVDFRGSGNPGRRTHRPTLTPEHSSMPYGWHVSAEAVARGIMTRPHPAKRGCRGMRTTFASKTPNRPPEPAEIPHFGIPGPCDRTSRTSRLRPHCQTGLAVKSKTSYLGCRNRAELPRDREPAIANVRIKLCLADESFIKHARDRRQEPTECIEKSEEPRIPHRAPTTAYHQAFKLRIPCSVGDPVERIRDTRPRKPRPGHIITGGIPHSTLDPMRDTRIEDPTVSNSRGNGWNDHGSTDTGCPPT